MSAHAAVDAVRGPFDATRDRAFWERFFGPLERRCLTLALRLIGDQELARDAVQEGFMRAFRSQKQLNQEANAERWLLAIVANAARELGRSRERGRQREHLEGARPIPADPAHSVAQEDALHAALGQLEEEPRLFFLLFHQEGFSYEEIARRFGCPLGTVRSRLHRARLRLAELLQEGEGIQP